MSHANEAVLCIPDEDLEGMIARLEAINRGRRGQGDGLGAFLGTGIPDLPGIELRTIILEYALRELKFLREFNQGEDDE